MRNRLMWLLLVVLGGALLLLVWRHEDGTVAGLDNDDFASLVVRASLSSLSTWGLL